MTLLWRMLFSDLHWRPNDTSQPPHQGGAGGDPGPSVRVSARDQEHQLTVSASSRLRWLWPFPGWGPLRLWPLSGNWCNCPRSLSPLSLLTSSWLRALTSQLNKTHSEWVKSTIRLLRWWAFKKWYPKKKIGKFKLQMMIHQIHHKCKKWNSFESTGLGIVFKERFKCQVIISHEIWWMMCPASVQVLHPDLSSDSGSGVGMESEPEPI